MPRTKQIRNVALARAQRKSMSLPEVLLWQELRSNDEVKFRRQHPIGAYILDFYCAKRKLAVEIDGIAHSMGDRPVHDTKRDAWLADEGIEVVRFAAREVLADPKAVAESLIVYCRH